jgi:hypothetical protein
MGAANFRHHLHGDDAALNIVAAVMALVLLKPMRIKTMSNG